MYIPRNSLMVSCEALLLLEEMSLWMLARIMEACQRQRVRIMEACQRQLVKEIFCSSRLKFRRFEHLSGSVPFLSAAIHDSGYRSSVCLVTVCKKTGIL